jgi:hypothetical protein
MVSSTPNFGRKALSLITALFVLLTLFVSGPAQAAPPPAPVKTGSGVPDSLQPCIGEALSSKAQQCVCGPAGLEIQVDGNGKSRARNQTPKVEPSQAPSPAEGRNQHSQEDSSGDVELMAGGTEYDTWCENGSICRRNITRYVSETKGNAAYGTSMASLAAMTSSFGQTSTVAKPTRAWPLFGIPARVCPFTTRVSAVWNMPPLPALRLTAAGMMSRQRG